MNFQIVLILGIAGCYLIGTAMEGYAWGGSANWDPERRQRILARMARYETWLRLIDFAGIALIVAGLLRFYGALRFIPLTASRILILAVVVLCFERVARGWATWQAFRESDEPGVRTRGLLAAFASTILQTALAVWVGWWVVTHVKVLPPRGGSSSGGRTPPGQVLVTPGGEEQVVPENVSPWMDEREALELLGKDKEYLELLIPQMEGMFGTPVRMLKDGKVFYHRPSFEKYKEGGLPMLEDLRRARPQEKTPAPKPPEPLTEGDLLRE